MRPRTILPFAIVSPLLFACAEREPAPPAAPVATAAQTAAPPATSDPIPVATAAPEAKPLTARDYCTHGAQMCPKLDVDACTRRVEESIRPGRCEAQVQAFFRCATTATKLTCDSETKALADACEPLVKPMERCLGG